MIKSLLIAFFAVALVTAISASATELASDTLKTSAGDLVIHPVNHATFVMEWNGKTYWVDPVGDADLFADFAKPDVILITHIHGDHTSAETVGATATESTTIVAPKTVAEKLGDVPGTMKLIAPGESLETDDIRIDAIPAYNFTKERLDFHPKERGDNSYVVTLGGTRIFVSGDTEDVPEMRSLKEIDAAFVCMNLPYTMDVDAAAAAVLAFAPKVVYPYHYRGKGGVSDLEHFGELVAENPEIEVRLLDWY